MPKIAIIGTTTWGITLGVVLACKGLQVRLWARTESEATELRNAGPSSAGLCDRNFPPQLLITDSLTEALAGVKAVILAVPSQTMRHNIRLVADYVKGSMLVVSVAKGLEIGSSKRMSQVISDEINPRFWPNICVLSPQSIQGDYPRLARSYSGGG